MSSFVTIDKNRRDKKKEHARVGAINGEIYYRITYALFDYAVIVVRNHFTVFGFYCR